MPPKASARTRSISPSTQATGRPSRAASRDVPPVLRGTWMRLCPPIGIARSPSSLYRLVRGSPGRSRASGSRPTTGLEGSDVGGRSLRPPDAFVVLTDRIVRVRGIGRGAPGPKAVVGGADEARGRLDVVDERQAFGHRPEVAVAVVPRQVADHEVACARKAVAANAGIPVVGDDVVGDGG